jgi:signal transduction histidine kinase
MTDRALYRLAWSVCALTLLVLAASLLLILLGWSTPLPQGVTPWRDQALFLAGLIGAPILGGLIASRRPRNSYGWVWLAFGLSLVVQQAAHTYANYARWVEPGSLVAPLTIAHVFGLGNQAALGLAPFLLLLFPTGRLPSRRWRPLAWISALSAVAIAVLVFFFGSPDQVGGAVTIAAWATVFAILATFVLSTISLVIRFRAARGTERQQLKWFALAAVFAVLVFAVGTVLGLERLVGETLWTLINAVSNAFLYSAVGIAILRYRLYDIDIIINRTLVYGALTATVVVLYVLIVGTLGAVFRARGDLVVSLTAAGVVAVLFAPLRERFQPAVNRLMYGERDDPYAVLSRVGRRLEATVAPEAALTTIVETIAQAFKVPYVAIEFGQDGKGESVTVVEHGSPEGDRLTLPLVYQRKEIGLLIVAPRAPGESFSAADTRLLEDLARQVGVTVHAVGLTADLQRSRESLVSTREEERRRLRRDLHDGLGPTLGALTLGLDTARLALAQEDPKAVDGLLIELKAQTQEAVSDVRRLVYGLRPPALDDLGLVPAIRQQATNHGTLAEEVPNGEAARRPNGDNGLVFSVEVLDDPPPLPAAVEVACYRIAQEAITNASRHSGAKSCRLSLSLERTDSTLRLEIADDGTGIPDDRSAGVGMSSMRERAEELGGTLTVGALPEGGTRVLATLPLPETGEEE